jgi:aspartate dehydrogenase
MNHPSAPTRHSALGTRHSLRVGLIGLGAIGRPLLEAISAGEAGPATVTAALVRQPTRYSALSTQHTALVVTDDPATFLAQPLDVVVEAGGHEALRQHAEAVLRQGCDLVVVSVGAFADDALLARLQAVCESTGRQILVPSGAIAGLDVIGAGAVGGLDEVSITTRKPPAAWRGTPAEAQALAATEPVLLYEGSARQGVMLFPQNVNVAAALALAGVGLDATLMRVYADPTVTHNTHEVQARGPFGAVRLLLQNVPSAENPKTGRIVAMSVLKAVRNLRAPLVVGL